MKYGTLLVSALLCLIPVHAVRAEPITITDAAQRVAAAQEETSQLSSNVDQVAGNISRDIKALIDKGEQLGCGQASGEHGGSLATSMEQLMRDLIQDVKGSLMGAARGQVRDFLNRISANAGPLAPVVQPLVNFIGAKADALIRQAGEKIFSFIDPSGAANTALSGVAQAVGLNLGNMVIGAGLIGGAIPGVGTLSVPVNETGAVLSHTRQIDASSQNIDKQTAYIKDAQGVQTYIACVANPAIAKLKHAIIAKQTHGMIKKASEMHISDIYNAAQRTGEHYALKAVAASAQGMCSSHRQEVLEMVLDQFSSSGSGSQCIEEYEVKPGEAFDFSKEVTRLANPTTNSSALQFLNAYARVQQEGMAASAAAVLEYMKNRGFGNTYECDENRELTPGEICRNGRIVMHGNVFANALSDMINTPTQQLVQADEIGELIDAMSAGLMQVAFQNARGLLGLVERGARGSYLDEMVAQNYDEPSVSPQRVLTGDIEGALVIETQYGQALDLVLADLTAAKKNYEDVALCYEPIKIQGKGDITPQIATDAISLATTTVGVAINPQIAALAVEKRNSDSALQELVELVNAAETALSPRDIVEVSARFSALKASGRMHTATDLQALINSMEFSAASIERMLRDASILLTACKKNL